MIFMRREKYGREDLIIMDGDKVKKLIKKEEEDQARKIFKLIKTPTLERMKNQSELSLKIINEELQRRAAIK